MVGRSFAFIRVFSEGKLLNVLLLCITAAVAGYCYHWCCFVVEAENIVGSKLICFDFINLLLIITALFLLEECV